MKYKEEKLLELLENLFNPISQKDYGLYWLVSNKKTKPLANAKELLNYIKNEAKNKKTNGSFINRYSNLSEELVLENNIYLDFDLTNNGYLKAEDTLTINALKELAAIDINIDNASNYHEKNKNTILKQIQQKYKKSIDGNGFKKGLNSFIDSLTIAEEGALKRLVGNLEKKELKELTTEKEVQQYYVKKFEQRYLKEPYDDVIRAANYFESIGVRTIINLSGSKGFHLRIPISRIDFNDVPELAENPEAVKIFLEKLAELIETKILKKPYKKSSLDYAVFKKGMQRLPTSKHNKTKLYGNFIKPSTNYLEAIDYLEEKVPSYVPSTVNTEENTKKLLDSDIYKATIRLAAEETTKTFDSEVSNSNYDFKGQHKELLETISKVYLPSVRNEVGYRIVHLLRRSNFKQSEVEAIFQELHEDYTDYKNTIEGSIIHAYKTEKLVGLRSLIKWLEANASEEVKDEVVTFFKRKFNYFEVAEETILEDKLNIDNASYDVIFQKTKTTEKYIVPEFMAAEYSLEILPKAYLKMLQNGKAIAKLSLADDNSTIRSKSKSSIKPFEKKIQNKTELAVDFKEVIEELDLLVGNFNIQKEKEEKQEKQEKEITAELEEGFYNFKFNGHNETYLQTKEGIFQEFQDKNGDPYYKPVANVVIKDVTTVLDSLGILEPVYNVSYYNRTFKEEVTVEYLTEKQLTEEFIKAKVFYNATKDSINYIINSFIITASNEGLIETRTEAYLEGFFYINNNVISNTKINNIKTPTKEELAEAIQLLNNLMKDRTAEGKANDSAVYKFMLWSPFSYCLKQLGYSKANYSLILIGTSQTNKTGATKIGNLFYNRNEEETTGSTVSVLGSKLGENSFTSIFDECSHLFNLPEALNVMKRAIYEKTGRAVKDRNDNNKIDEFTALNLPLFILNERKEFKDYITNRYKVIDYSSESFISDSNIARFNEKYVPEAADTILRKLALIGKVFSTKLIRIIEDPTERKKRLFNIEELTISLLKEMQEEAGVEFDPAMLNKTIASDKYNYNVMAEIPKVLNEEFKKKNKLPANSPYGSSTFVNSVYNNDFDFITYNKNRTTKTEHKEFIINTSKLEKYVLNHVNETVSLETILEALNLTDKLKAKPDYKEPYSSYIKKQHKIRLKEPSGKLKERTISGVYLSTEELTNNLFGFDIDYDNSEKTSIIKEKVE